MKKQLQKSLSLLLMLVMLLSLLPTPAQAVGKEPGIPIPTTLTFTTEPQSGTALKTEGYTITWATNKTPDILLLQIMVTNKLSGAISWADVGSAVEPTGPSGTITVRYPSAAERRPGEQSTYRLTVGCQGTEVETDTCTFTVTWTHQTYTVTVNGGTGSGKYEEGASVTIAADEPGPGWGAFKEWDGADGLTFTEGSASAAAATFTMPAGDVELTATYQRIKPYTTPVRPEGRGTVVQPFRISTVGELYWFAGFVNGTITADDISMSVNEVHAKLMNDITVNPNLLTKDYTLNVSEEDTALLVPWEPITPANDFLYTGTFDGQGHTISGIYCAPQPGGTEYGFFTSLSTGGCIRDLTLADSYFRAPTEKANAYTGGIVGQIGANASVENCHFDGTVTTGDSEGTDTLGGVAASNLGDIRNCTSKGLISGYAKNAIGGIVGSMVQGTVTDCVNEATVENLVPLTGMDGDSSGGIVGTMATGTVRNCCNKGDVSGNNSGGIVGGAGWPYREGAAILRCWNEGTVENGAGIAETISGDNVTIKNCYNAGSVRYGIVSSYTGSGHSVTYCHNVGELTAGFSHGAPIISAFDSDSDIVVANCYYMADSELDEVDGTTALSADRFSRQDIQMVTKLLNSKNAGNWKQGDGYPVLTDVGPTTIRGVCVSYQTNRTSVPEIVVEDYYGPGATLVVAQYVDGCLRDLRLVAVTGDATFRFSEDVFDSVDGAEFIAYLYDESFSPICASAPLEVMLR